MDANCEHVWSGPRKNYGTQHTEHGFCATCSKCGMSFFEWKDQQRLKTIEYVPGQPSGLKLMTAKIEVIFHTDATAEEMESFYRGLLKDYDGTSHCTNWASVKVTDCSENDS